MKLTKNFRRQEFDSKDGSKMPDNVLTNVKELANNLQVIRDYINEPMSINSGYRSVKHNKKVKGSPNSQHLTGKAADITVRDKSPKEVADIIIKLINEGRIKKGGVGLYNGFVHYDIRGVNARWDYSTKYDF